MIESYYRMQPQAEICTTAILLSVFISGLNWNSTKFSEHNDYKGGGGGIVPSIKE